MYRQPDSLLNFRKKVKKFAFDHCKTCSEHYEELAQEQNIALANFRRKKLSQTGIRGSNGNIKYLTFDEASYLAKVSRSMINKWAALPRAHIDGGGWHLDVGSSHPGAGEGG